MAERHPPVQAEILEGMPEPQPVHIDPSARNALARTLTPGYHGLREEHYLDINPEMVARAEPQAFKASLIGGEVQGDHDAGQFFVWYDSPESRRAIKVAVSAQEYLLMKGSIQTLGSRVVARTVAARTQPDGFMVEVNRAAAQRSGVHSVDGRLPQMKNYVHKELKDKFDLINKFKEASATGSRTGLARFGDEGKMREAFVFLQTYVFDEMFKVIGSQRGWSSEQAKLAQRTVTKRMFFDRDHNKHITYFRELLDVAETWNGYKRAIVAGRIYHAELYQKQHKTDERSV